MRLQPICCAPGARSVNAEINEASSMASAVNVSDPVAALFTSDEIQIFLQNTFFRADHFVFNDGQILLATSLAEIDSGVAGEVTGALPTDARFTSAPSDIAPHDLPLASHDAGDHRSADTGATPADGAVAAESSSG